MRTLFGGSAASAEDAASIAASPAAANKLKSPHCFLITSSLSDFLCMANSEWRVANIRPYRCLCPIRYSPFAIRLERIGIRLVLDRHPLPAGELLPVGGPADARAVAGRAGPAEGNVRLVSHGLVVDVQEPCAQPVAERQRAADRLGEHAGRE